MFLKESFLNVSLNVLRPSDILGWPNEAWALWSVDGVANLMPEIHFTVGDVLRFTIDSQSTQTRAMGTLFPSGSPFLNLKFNQVF